MFSMPETSVHVLDKNREISPFMEIDGRRLEAFEVYGCGRRMEKIICLDKAINEEVLRE